MSSLKWHFVFSCIFLFGIENACSMFLENLIAENNTIVELLEMYIPTLRAPGEQCRNASVFYAEELQKYTLWASEMFDATTKFPTGILYGVRYDFGHFDECMDLRIPYKSKNMYGKYCLAKFTVSPPIDADTGPEDENVEHKSVYKYEFHDYVTYYNLSMWRKLNDYGKDDTRTARNEIHFAFCIPSLCSKKDLDHSLKELVQIKFNNTSFVLNVEVGNDTCQIDEEVKLEAGDIVFIVFSVSIVCLVIISSFYDKYTKRDDFKKYKLAERPHQAMLCFSFPRNFRKLTAINGNLDGLNCMAGMRLYTMFVIVFLHRNIFDYGSAMYNPVVIERHYSKFELSFVGNAPIVVETFFTISGFLATYLSLYNFHVQKKNINVIMQYIHRYIRMTPTYAVVLAFYCTLLTKMGNGPLWDEIVTKEQKRCKNNWWANLLYVNNYVDTDNYCMFQSWYVACDMNAFILVPIICLILCKKPKVGVAVLISLIIGFNLIALITVWTEEEDPIVYVYLKSLLNPFSDSTFKYVYIPGHMRAAPYYIGVLAAYIKYQINVKNYKFPKQYVRLGWILAVILMFTSLHLAHWFYIHDVEPVFKVLYAAFYHVAWSLSIAWMVIAISSGYGSWVEPLLSCPAAIILARLTYSVFVSHGIIMLVSRGGARYPIYAGVFKKIHSSAGDIFLAWILGFVLYMLIESPLIAFERVIFWTGSRGKKSVKKSPPETTTDLPTTN